MQNPLIVFVLKNDADSSPGNFYPIGEINQFDSAILRRKYQGAGNFELWAPITAENREFFKNEGDGSVKFIYFGDYVAGFIEQVRSEVNSRGQLKYYVSGRTCEGLLYFRAFGLARETAAGNNMIANTTTFNGLTAKKVIQKMLSNCHSADWDGLTVRKFPFMVAPQFGTMPNLAFNYQRSGGNLYDAIVDFISQDSLNLGFWLKFDPYEKKLVPYIYAGADRSAAQDVNVPVVFSDELNDILQSQYLYDFADYRNVAYVAGEGEGSARDMIQTTREDEGYNLDYNSNLGGLRNFTLREIYIDARDVSRKSGTTETNEGDIGPTELSDAEYFEVLGRRGTQKLADYNLLQNFTVTIKTEGNVVYKYGRDYNLGDIITIEDTRLGITVNTRVTASEETFGADYSLRLAFGEQPQTLSETLGRINNGMTN